MSHFPSIPNLELLGLFTKFPDRGMPRLFEYHDAILRNGSELTMGERELIATYVSSLKDCHYRFSAHGDHAKAWAMPAGLFGDLRVDLDHPDLPDRMKPVLTFVHRLTVDPAGTGMADAPGVYDAKFSEEGLFNLISVTRLHKFMNRVLEGAVKSFCLSCDELKLSDPKGIRPNGTEIGRPRLPTFAATFPNDQVADLAAIRRP